LTLVAYRAIIDADGGGDTMLYSNLKAIYRDGKFKLLEPLRLPEGATVRLSVQTESQAGTQSIMKFAGAWQDMPEVDFEAFLVDVNQRRQAAFARRRERETFNG
jgi:predicted DNA-binding antitoxin AbrB/MazE fold protein